MLHTQLSSFMQDKMGGRAHGWAPERGPPLQSAALRPGLWLALAAVLASRGWSREETEPL